MLQTNIEYFKIFALQSNYNVENGDNPMAIQRYWCITGYDSTTKLFEFKVKHGCFSDSSIKDLIRCLTAKYALTDNEIVSAYARNNTKIAAPLLLDVQHSQKSYSFSCGANIHVHAIVVEETK